MNEGNVSYTFSEDGKVAYGTLANGVTFIIDADMIDKLKGKKFYVNTRDDEKYQLYITDSRGRKLHDHLFEHRKGYEVDHINLNTLDNRRCNIRYCSHKQNQMNQPLQRNNTSGVSGVSYYPPRGKYRARIKISQHEIHLGYYDTFEKAVMARNIGMKCMFGAYGRYNPVGDIPKWIEEKVVSKCIRYSDYSENGAFFDFWE